MALQSSGQISFSDIAAEFGGVKPYSMSEYRALSDMGVSGIPSTGTMRCSQFHGKSNQVTTSVWVSSGYNESYWLNRGHHPQSFAYGENSGWYPTSYYYYWSANHGTGWTISQTDYGTGWSDQQRGNTKYWKSSFQWGAANGNQDRYYMAYATLETRWVDTSGYQTQTTTAQITT